MAGGRRMIWNRWFLAGAAIAVAFQVPDLWWQAQHQWATIATTHAPAPWPSTHGCRRGLAGCAIS